MIKSFGEYIKEGVEDQNFNSFDELKEYLENEIYNLVMEWYTAGADNSSAEWTEEDAEAETSRIIDVFKQNKNLL